MKQNQCRRLVLTTVLVFLCAWVEPGSGENQKQGSFIDSLFEGYEKKMPLVSAGPLLVDISMHVIDFYKEGAENIKLNLYFRIKWRDERLQFNTSDNGHQNTLVLEDRRNLWIPDIFIPNAIETKTQEFFKPNSLIRLESDGTLLISNQFIVEIPCIVQRLFFPFDEMSCPIGIESYGYGADKLHFRKTDSKHVRVVFDPRSVFTGFDHKETTTDMLSFSTTTGRYSRVRVGLIFKRQSAYYVTAWQVPCMMLVIISFLSQLLAPENITGRVLLTLIPLMILVLLGTFIKFNSPSFSSKPTAMDIFAGVSVLVTFLVLLLVLIGNHCQRNYKKIPSDEDAAAAKETLVIKAKRNCRLFLSRYFLPSFYLLFIIWYYQSFARL